MRDLGSEGPHSTVQSSIEMRSLFGGFLIVAGLAAAATGLDGAQTKATNAESQRIPEPTLSTIGKEAAGPVNTVVTLPAKSHAHAVPATVAVAPVAGPELVGDLQTELTRVGCYNGPINGIWTPQTRKAMITLVQRSNARLPADKADHVLLALVKNHTGSACGSCPTGQEESPEGHCVPQAIAAHVAVLRPVSSLHLLAEGLRIVDVDQPQPAPRSRRRSQLEGRMGVGAPIVAPRTSKVEPKIAAVEPTPSGPAPAVQPRREKRAARHASRRIAGHSMRARRYAYRPLGRPRGIAALLFGWF